MGTPRYSAEEFKEVRLMVANADITIYHKTGRDPQTRADVWAATVYTDVHLYSKLAAQESGNGRAPANTYTVRIFGAQGAPCRIGDVVACGITTQPTHKQCEPPEWSALRCMPLPTTGEAALICTIGGWRASDG